MVAEVPESFVGLYIEVACQSCGFLEIVWVGRRVLCSPSNEVGMTRLQLVISHFAVVVRAELDLFVFVCLSLILCRVFCHGTGAWVGLQLVVVSFHSSPSVRAALTSSPNSA